MMRKKIPADRRMHTYARMDEWCCSKLRIALPVAPRRLLFHYSTFDRRDTILKPTRLFNAFARPSGPRPEPIQIDPTWFPEPAPTEGEPEAPPEPDYDDGFDPHAFAQDNPAGTRSRRKTSLRPRARQNRRSRGAALPRIRQNVAGQLSGCLGRFSSSDVLRNLGQKGCVSEEI